MSRELSPALRELLRSQDLRSELEVFAVYHNEKAIDGVSQHQETNAEDNNRENHVEAVAYRQSQSFQT